ncbi:hypothetical protein SPRG_11862 [Saprolegnia parasitica CBS 223.65]|uniref:Ricin B lectin domain-containing protein n=1 Tax=Saprolegnia parasitica (strain CBS 223.65) TaxID=695850 RepID=A0A067C8X8_SAPPC|nr:hypothetical protein SPRG_11862 [Saprolegnia parasitica CBS 223.65]KDO23016.1 hypothetical protein SPRG_11862 [Saprolegnia parasitica CBS 223.65]|eukprot:XP_012206304.1 hypothetical protein SPRG_11862 [Saprolegnia parasitica CBS 223.65]
MMRLAKLTCALLVAAMASPVPLDIGADNALALSADGSKPVSQIIERSGATYISVHFSSMNLPDGASITITSLDGSKKVSYNGKHDNLFTTTIDADRVVLTYSAPSYEKASSGSIFVVDKFISGTGGSKNLLESICGTDNSKPSHKAVARLLINGRSLCTGWLIGSEGHMMTNWHCIQDAVKAKNVQVEFAAKCATCDDANNTVQRGCKGDIVATDVEFIVSDKKTDFALVKLNLKDGANLKQYGYLKVRPSGPILNEEIYIPQHPNGHPQHMALVDDNGAAGKITDLSSGSCYNDIPEKDYVGHQLDTQGGSSGSPMLSTKENTVVALHNCGGCNNGGIKMNRIVDFLKSKNIPLPKDATSDAPTYAPTSAPTTQSPAPANTISFCSISNRVLSEYYRGLYQDTPKGNKNEQFVYDQAAGTLAVQSNGECLDAYAADAGFKLHTWACDATNGNQKWIVANNQIVHKTHNVCLTSIAGKNDVALAACDSNDIRQRFSTSCKDKNVRSYVQIRTKRGKYISEWNGGLYADVGRNNANELFELDSANQWIKSVSNNGQCWDAYKDSNGVGHLHTYACSTGNANQKWIIANGQIKHATHANLCLDVDPNDANHRVQVWDCGHNNDNQKFDVLVF